MTKAGLAQQMFQEGFRNTIIWLGYTAIQSESFWKSFQSFQKMSLQKQVMECQELEHRQRELQRNIDFYKEQQEKIQSEKENQIKKILEQIKPEVKLKILFYGTFSRQFSF